MRDRRELTRYGVPAAFLAAVTLAVLLIKAGLSGGDSSATTTTGRALPSTSATRARVTSTHARVTERQYYTIQSGDTLGAIALRQHTTVDELLRLNPGIDPLSLHTGSRIRVH